MSEENVEVARQSADAIARRDRATWLALHDADCAVVAIDEWPEAGARGAEAAWDFYVPIFDAFERVTGQSGIGEVEQVDAGADKVLVHHRPDLLGRESGAGVELNYWCVATFRQGKIVHEHWFVDRAEALEPPGCGSRRCRRRTWRSSDA